MELGKTFYDLIKMSGNPWIGWLDISIKPPNNIALLVNIKNWGCAIGILLNDNSTFRFTLPHPDSPNCLEMNINLITHWAPVPELLEVGYDQTN